MEKDKEEELKKSLISVLGKEELRFHRQLIKRLSAELQISTLDCAAAICFLNYPAIPQIDHAVDEQDSELPVVIIPKQKFVRYRLDVGRNHSVSVEDIKKVLIEVSGVDKNRIGRIDIRNFYSLVDLPEGMPADIYQMLSEEELNQRKLNLKRVKHQPRFYRRNNKK